MPLRLRVQVTCETQCLLLGGNSGLGIETARAMAHAGAKVILTSRKVEAGQKVAQELQSSGVKVSLSSHPVILAAAVSCMAVEPANIELISCSIVAGTCGSSTARPGRSEQRTPTGQTAEL